MTGPATREAGLELAGVSYVVGLPLLDDVTVRFRPGRLSCVAGPSGSGKTTLLSVAGGLLAPTTGTATLDGRPTWQGTGDPLPEVAFVLQVYGLVPVLSARENIAVALRARGRPGRRADARADEVMERLHIGDLADRQVEELSGGQMQRVAVARALAPDAAVVLADEPTSELDEDNRELVVAELRARADAGAVVVIATHDAAVAEACDERYVVDDGRLHPAGRHAGPAGHREPTGPAGHAW